MKFFIYTFLLLLCYSCNESAKQGITIGNNSYIDFYTMTDSILLTPLKMKEEFMIGEINKIKSTDSLYFLLDANRTNSLYTFDKKGCPIAKFGNTGRGPEEYLSIYDFDIDYRNQKVIILCNPSKVFITDLYLHIEKIIPLKSKIERIACYDNYLYCYSHNERKLMTLNRGNGDLTEIFRQHNIPHNYLSDVPVFYKIDNKLYYCAAGSDIIYKIKNGHFQEVMTLQYKEKRKGQRLFKSHKRLSPQQALCYSPPSIHVLFHTPNGLSMIYTHKALVRYCQADTCHQTTIQDGIIVNQTGDIRMYADQNTLTTWLFIPNKQIPFDNAKVTLMSPLLDIEEANPVLVKFFGL